MDNMKSKYKKPTVYMVKVRYQTLLDSESDGHEGPANSRQQRPDWDED